MSDVKKVSEVSALKVENAFLKRNMAVADAERMLEGVLMSVAKKEEVDLDIYSYDLKEQAFVKREVPEPAPQTSPEALE